MGGTKAMYRWVIVPMLVVPLLLVGCSDDDTTTPAATGGTPAGGGQTVAVTLQEFAVGVDPTTAAAGEVTFDVSNIGPDDVHEFVVIRTDLSITDLPTDDKGAVDESGEGMEVIDEIEDMEVNDTQTLTVDLDAGSYALICNIYDKSENEAHYSEGMRTQFTVT
jgi:uncharacterized cupredoxin-like copper-binding protein